MARVLVRPPIVCAAGLLLTSAGLVAVAATGWRGPAPTGLVLLAVFLGPGLGWQSQRGTLSFSPEQVGLAVAESIGTVVGLGLAMNATSVRLTRGHWTVALAIVLGALAVVTWVRAPEPEAHGSTPERLRKRLPRGSGVLAICLCATLVAIAGAITWLSQQRWLDRQHYTELYATATGGGEQVTVHNHEGEPVSYTASIQAAGSPFETLRFNLPAGGTWIHVVSVDPGEATAGRPLLAVDLGRVGVRGVYRSIRLLRLQPSVSPAG